MFLDHNMKLCKIIEIYLRYDNMHTFGIINALNGINNHVNSCMNSMLSFTLFWVVSWTFVLMKSYISSTLEFIRVICSINREIAPSIGLNASSVLRGAIRRAE